ncbi:MAG: GNAT family N-acetyltransferase [Novosphingobium sp.]|nr:GNAT family N-acetyltransferase [Novosphingobium sp.]
MSIHVRPATPDDLPLIAVLIRELAEYEQMSDAVRFDEADMALHLFGPRPAAEALIGELDGTPQGYALCFTTFSTFEGRPGLWLEDLFVRPDARGGGLGKALLAAIAGLARARRCARLEWSVLDWNEPAIAFYRKLGAQALDGWTTMRLEGDVLSALGSRAIPGPRW